MRLHRGRDRRYAVELVQGSGHIRSGYAHYVEMPTGPHQVHRRDGRRNRTNKSAVPAAVLLRYTPVMTTAVGRLQVRGFVAELELRFENIKL